MNLRRCKQNLVDQLVHVISKVHLVFTAWKATIATKHDNYDVQLTNDREGTCLCTTCASTGGLQEMRPIYETYRATTARAK